MYKLDIFGLKYSVKRGKLEQGVAQCNYTDKTITVDPSQSGQKFDECIIHEIGNAIIDRVGGGSTSLNRDLEEIIVDSLAKVISENYRLVKR